MRLNKTKFRMAFAFGAILLKALLSFLTGLLLARGLGPEIYGNMAFLLGTSLGMRQLLDMGSSMAFYTFLAQKSRSRRFAAYYMGWQVLQLAIPILLIWLLFPDKWVAVIWKDEPRGLIIFSFLAAFLQNGLWPTILQMGESQRKTHFVQSVGVGIALMQLTVVVLLWIFSELGLYLVFGATAIEYLLGSWLVVSKLHFEEDVSPGETFASVFKEYAAYCYPLVFYAWVGFAYAFADPWLLQHFGGNKEQSYFAISMQMASFLALAAASVQNIFWKEIAEAHHLGDVARVAKLYRKLARILYTGSAIMAGFLMPWAHDILQLLYGPGYVMGATTLTIMFLYPVHQSLSYVTSSMLLATGRVHLQMATGIIFMLASIAVAYLMLAPPEEAIPGLGLASQGLAIKMVLMQFLQVNLVAFLIARRLNTVFDWSHQIVGLGIALLSGWVAHFLAFGLLEKWIFMGHKLAFFAAIALAGLIYLPTMLAVLYRLPWLLDLSKFEIDSIVSKLGFCRDR